MSKVDGQKFIFLAGAPKCGTSFLYSILKQHPEINPSIKKENYFFIDAEHGGINKENNVHLSSGTAFLSLFERKDSRFYLEGTTHLIYQKQMFDEIKALGDVKMILILRDPIERIVSTFDFTKNNLGNIKDRKEYNLDNYLEVLLSGKVESLKTWMRNTDGFYVFSRELDYCKYFEYVDEWKNKLGAENLRVIQFEDFIPNRLKYISELCSWLGIEKEFVIDELSKNKSFTVRNTWLHRMSVKAARLLPRNKVKKALKHIYFKVQGSEHQKSTISDKNKEQLRIFFKKSNERLKDEYDFDLSYWKN